MPFYNVVKFERWSRLFLVCADTPQEAREKVEKCSEDDIADSIIEFDDDLDDPWSIEEVES